MLFSGDLHGKFNDLISLLEKHDITDTSICNVGDFGVGFNHDDLDRLNRLNEVLSHRNINLYAQRGNHDDPRYYMGKYMNFFSNLHLVPDYTIVNTEDKNILFIGGAISVDRIRMKKEMLKEEAAGKLPIYFENEAIQFDNDKIDLLNNLRGVDIVVTHTAPDYCYPLTKGPIPVEDKTLQKELDEERLLLGCMIDAIIKNNNITHHYYGHFHHYNYTVRNGVNHICLGINDLK